MALTLMKSILCFASGLVLFFANALENMWMLWDHLELASYPYEAYSGANSKIASTCILLSSVLSFTSSGWYLANDSKAFLLALFAQASQLIAVYLFEFSGQHFLLTQVLFMTVCLLEILYGPTNETRPQIPQRKSWYKNSMVVKEFCIAFLAVLISLSYRAQPSCFGKLHTNHIPLIVSSNAIGEYKLGNSHMLYVKDGLLELTENNKKLFSTIPKHSFLVSAIDGSISALNEEENGLFDITDLPGEKSVKQSVDSVKKDAQNGILIKGKLYFSSGTSTNYTITLFEPETGHVNYRIEQDGKDISRTYLIQASDLSEHIFGMGIQYTYFNQRGGCVPVFTQEQGIGRGLQPLTYFLNLIAKHAPGSWQISYSPVPHFLTSRMKSMYLKSSEFSVFDFSEDDRIVIEVNSSSISGGFCSGESYFDIIKCYSDKHAGYMRALPDWVGNGAIIGLQGGTKIVKEKLEKLLNANVPVAGIWLQDWSGKRETLVGRRLQWNWEVDHEFYPGWSELIQELKRKKIFVLSYINPYLADKGKLVNVFQKAKSADCLLRSSGGDVLIQASGTSEFTFGTVDIMNDRCRDWYIEEVIRKEMIGVGTKSFSTIEGVMGWMSDFAEGISMDSVSEFGLGHSFHNQFPVRWSETCRKAIGMNNFTEKNIVFFARSGGSQSPRYSTLMWMGDQLTTWDEKDGMKSALGGLLSGGLSGFSLAHSDVGGYTMVKFLYQRSAELMKRWTEMNAFSDPVFRTHEGLKPEESAQAYSPSCLKHFAKFSSLHRRLFPILKRQLIDEASTSGKPFIRHMMLHYPDDPASYLPETRFQFMLGKSILVCPVFQVGAESVECYVPKGEWRNVFTGQKYGQANGERISCPAPIGRPCVLFLPEASAIANVIRETLSGERTE